MATKTIDWDFELHYRRQVEPLIADAPWQLRVTDRKGKPSPVLLIKQRRTVPVQPLRNDGGKKSKKKKTKSEVSIAGAAAEKVIWQDHGLIYGSSLRRCLPAMREIVSRVKDRHQIGLELQRLLPLDRIPFRGNLPLDDEAGCKLALIFRLQERVKELERVELIALRVATFTREEASYWLSRMTNFGEDANRWAVSGLKIVLGGQAKDQGVERMLQQLHGNK